MKLELSPEDRRRLRADAHHLDPVVMIGNEGLTPAVLHEIDVNLNAHGLIKIRVFGGDRAARDALLAQIAADLDAAEVQHIGKLLVVFRPLPEPAKKPRTRSPQPAKDSKDSARPKLRPGPAPRGVPRAPGEARRSRIGAAGRGSDRGSSAGRGGTNRKTRSGPQETPAGGTARTGGARGTPGRRRPRSQP